MKKILFFFLILVVYACNTSKKEKSSEELIMVKQSEMAALMLNMYDISANNKKMILNGQKPKNYPKLFNNIHSAVLTTPSDRDKLFNEYSDFFLKNVTSMYANQLKDSLVLKHNKIVNSCISCHEIKCPGPISTIKKLYIN